ncbi:MAG TPA: hypothetical protein VJ866_21740 [Pyrinomonadaceae bacterium]|nr:hypothetical protein [Pyrinomonadaceae bacterium]
MKKLLTVLLLLAAATSNARQQGAKPSARLVDSFGEIQLSYMVARLDSFANELQNDPAARGLVVAYSERNKFPGWPMRRALWSAKYLADSRGLDRARLAVIDGGRGEETKSELWVVPAGAESPVKPYDAALTMAGEKAPLPFDRIGVVERGDPDYSIYGQPHPDDEYLYAYFSEVLRRDPALRGCVIGYTSKRGPRAAGRRIASRAKLTMAKAHGTDVSRVYAFGGGRREYKTIELWLVPPGAELPKPTPDLRTPRRKRQ